MSRTYRERGPYADDDWKGHSDNYRWREDSNYFCRRSRKVQRKRSRIALQTCNDFDNISFNDKMPIPDWYWD